MDPKRFLAGAKNFTKSVLSIGWTTNYGMLDNGAKYENENIQEMLNLIRDENVKHNITFPLRAGIAANSLREIINLVDGVSNSTVTLWSSITDYVNVDRLRKLIFSLGLDRVYIDVPEDLMEKLHLDDPVV